MAEDDDDAFTFGDFKFAPPQPLPINGGFTSSSQNGDVWADFFFSAPLQPNLSNDSPLSHYSPPNPLNNPKISVNFNLSGPYNGNPTQPTSDPSPIKPDPGPNQWQKHKGALPLSLFGEVEVEEEQEGTDSVANNGKDSSNNNHSHGWLNRNPPVQNGKFEVSSVSNGIGLNNNGYIFGKLEVPNQQIKCDKGSGSEFDGSASFLNNFDEEDDDEWEFKGADSEKGVEGNSEGYCVSSRSEVESVVMSQEKQAGQDASISTGHKPVSRGFSPQLVDIFTAHDGAVQRSSEMVINKGFMSDSFPGAEEIGNRNRMSATAVNEEDDFEDFGDFIDASQEVGSGGQEHIVPQTMTNEAQFCNGTIQPQQENNRGALPSSLFSDFEENSSDCLKFQDEMIYTPVSSHGNGSSNQTPGISIHDLISNLYSQAQHTSSVDVNQTPAGVGMPIDSTPPRDDDVGDDGSWEFKDAFSNTGVEEQLFSHSPGNVSQKPSESLPNLQFYMDFYATLKEALCFLISHQLEGEKKAQSSGSVIGNDGEAEALDYDIQEAYKLLEDSMISQEVLLKKHPERSTCLNEVLEALQGPELNVIESEYSLSKRLQLAVNEWRIATELLRHAISILRILSLGSVNEQSIYVSTWSKICNICCEELKYGALIWKKASEKNVRHQILSDHRGQRHIQALGEIYRVVELLGLSAKLYKPWILLSVSRQFFGLLDECRTLWSISGLEEALQNMSDNVSFGCNEPAKALITSVKNIRDLDVFTVHDLVFIQQKSVCRLSLLPEEMLADLKTVSWNEEPHFLNLANLWTNLISCNPPELPRLHVT